MDKQLTIVDSEGVICPNHILNEQAAAFWCSNIVDGKYVSPFKLEDNLEPVEAKKIAKNLEENWNWHAVLSRVYVGWDNDKISWLDLIQRMLAFDLGMCLIDISSPEEGFKLADFVEANGESHLNDDTERALLYLIEYYKPYVSLINYWMSLGYKVE